MSNSEFAAFYAKLFEDDQLQSLLASATDEEAFVARAETVARDAGLSVSADQIRKMISEPAATRELSEKELDAVAGGYLSYGGSLLCGFCGAQSGTCSSTFSKAPKSSRDT